MWPQCAVIGGDNSKGGVFRMSPKPRPLPVVSPGWGQPCHRHPSPRLGGPLKKGRKRQNTGVINPALHPEHRNASSDPKTQSVAGGPPKNTPGTPNPRGGGTGTGVQVQPLQRAPFPARRRRTPGSSKTRRIFWGFFFSFFPIFSLHRERFSPL